MYEGIFKGNTLLCNSTKNIISVLFIVFNYFCQVFLIRELANIWHIFVFVIFNILSRLFIYFPININSTMSSIYPHDYIWNSFLIQNKYYTTFIFHYCLMSHIMSVIEISFLVCYYYYYYDCERQKKNLLW